MNFEPNVLKQTDVNCQGVSKRNCHKLPLWWKKQTSKNLTLISVVNYKLFIVLW